MKFSGKIWLMIILKVAKNQGFILSLEDTFFKKPQDGSNWTPSLFSVNQKSKFNPRKNYTAIEFY